MAAAASLGAAAVARARPDGYTILLGGTQTHVNEALLKSRPLYDPVKDLDPIAGVAANVLCIAVHPSVPVQTLKELIAYAKANPGKLSYGHSGVGSIQHLAGELFKSLAGTPDIVQVPYRGTGPVITDLVGGQVPMGVPGVTGQVIEFHRSGKMRVLAVTSPTRLVAAPELPTAAELGFPGMTVTGSIGLLAPAGTPIGIIEQIAQASAHGGRRTGLQADVDRRGYRTHARLKPRKIPAVPRSRCCSLDAGRQSARAEDRLSVGPRAIPVYRPCATASFGVTSKAKRNAG